MQRFRVISGFDAKAQGLPGIDQWVDDCEGLLYDFNSDSPMLIASDYMQPEDACFLRDLAWVPMWLNALDKRLQEALAK